MLSLDQALLIEEKVAKAKTDDDLDVCMQMLKNFVEMDKSKFKVGDRVEIIDWNRTALKESNYHTNHKVESVIGYPYLKIMMFPKNLNNETYSFIHVDNLTLFEESVTESKPKCNFREGEIVIADLVRIGWKIPGCPEESEARIEKIDDEFIYIKLLRAGYNEAFFTIKDNNEFLYIKKIKRKKEKWSVGTYVEFFNKYELSDGNIIPDGFYEIVDYVPGLGIIEVSLKDFGIWKFIIGKLQIGKYKWHENKPEEYVKPVKGIWKEIDKHAKKIHESFLAEGSDEVFDYSKCTTSNNKTMDEYRDLLQSGKIKLSDVLEEWEKNNSLTGRGLWQEKFMIPKLSEYFWLLPMHKYLNRQSITISKQKQIKLNINKPKI